MSKVKIRVGEMENGKRKIHFMNGKKEEFPGFSLPEKDAELFKAAIMAKFCYKGFQLKAENKLLNVKILNLEESKKLHIQYFDLNVKEKVSKEKDFIVEKVEA